MIDGSKLRGYPYVLEWLADVDVPTANPAITDDGTAPVAVALEMIIGVATAYVRVGYANLPRTVVVCVGGVRIMLAEQHSYAAVAAELVDARRSFSAALRPR